MLLFSHSVMSDSVTPWTAACQVSLPVTNSQAYSNSCPLNRRCHPTISSSVAPFSSCLESFPASRSFPVSWLFAKVLGVSASASVLPMSIQGSFPLGWTDLISLLSKGLSRVFSNTTVRKHRFCDTEAFFLIVQLSHRYTTTGKTIALTIWTFVSQVMSLLCNII